MLVTTQNISGTLEIHILARQEVLREGGADFGVKFFPVGMM